MEENKCQICFLNIINDENYISPNMTALKFFTKCNHFFHIDCIKNEKNLCKEKGHEFMIKCHDCNHDLHSFTKIYNQ